MIRPDDAPPTKVLALPDHLLAVAFAAAGEDQLTAVRLACKAFLRPANEAARRLKLRRIPAVKLSDFPCIREVDASQVADWSETWLAHLCQAPLLESLKLGRHQPLTLVGAEALGRLRLQRLDLTGSTLRDSALQRLSGLHASLSSLSLRECCNLTDAGLAVLGGLGRLTNCDLSNCSKLTDATLGQLAAGCPRMRVLDLSSCERFRARLPAPCTVCCSEAGLRQLARLPLRTLLLSACCQLTDGCLQAVAEGMPQLECLGLFESGESVTDAGLAHLARLRGRLTALDLGYSCWAHTAVGLTSLLEQLPHLQMLNVGGCEGTTDAAVAAVAQHCQQLTMLDVSESQRMTAAGVRQLEKLPRLQELNLGWNIRLQDEALQGLAPSLTKLELSFCCGLTDQALAHAARLPRLAHCTLRKCGRVTDAGLRQLAACTSLQHLDLSYCSITAGGLAALCVLRQLSSLVLVDCIKAVHPPCMKLLAEQPGLVCLDLSDNKRLDDGCMQALSHASQLRSLRLDRCPKVSDHGLLALSRILKLRDLSIDRCPQLSPGALAHLQRKLVLLRMARPAGAHAGVAPIMEY